MRGRLLRTVAASAAVAAAVLAAVVVPGAPAAADDPTWSQVQAAKRSVATKAAEVRAIEADLGGLQQQAAELGAVVVTKAAAASAAEAKLRTAEAAYRTLRSRTRAAQASAVAARRSAAAVAAELYQSGTPALGVWLSGRQSGSLLYRLGALAQLSTTSSALLQRAVAEGREAAAISDQAHAAAAVRDALAAAAARAESDARAAEAAAEQQVAQTQARQATLQAQLTSLQATSNSLQQSWAAEQAAKQAAAAQGEGGGGDGSLSGISAGPGSLSPAAAQDYAESRLGAYGWGDGQMSCLTQLWNIESGWQWNAYNASSGAYGIPQSLPGSKMAAAGGDWTTDARTQIDWGMGYIRASYSTPCGALAFETSHTPYWY